MFGQPRCREWTPLATQQLRLRNLLQIVGYNMQASNTCGQQGSLYYTLHTTTMSAPFYTSEKLLSNHPKWREIDSELIHKMSSLYIVVRVWRHIRHKSSNTVPRSDVNKVHQQTDEIIQTWEVHFSGLLHIGANLSLNYTPKSFKENTLIFQMIGGYFCSYEKLRLQPVSRASLDVSEGGKAASPSKKIPINHRQSRNIKESKSVSPGRGIWKNDGIDNRFVSKSHSPPNVGLRQNSSYDGRASSSSKLISESYKDRFHNESDSVYEHSPKSDIDSDIREYSGSDSSNDKSYTSLSASNRDLSNIEESETAENYDANLVPVPKFRRTSIKFLKSEIRPSYNAEKLQKLHLLQYSIKIRSQEVQEIKEKIYQKSAMENSENLSPSYSLVDYEDFSRSENLCMSSREFSFLTGKCKHTKGKDLGKILSEFPDISLGDSETKPKKDSTVENDTFANNKNISRNIVGNTLSCDRRFTLPLNKLLEFKSQPSPSQRQRYAYLTKQVELSRFKRRLLKDERDTALLKIRNLQDSRTKLFEENQDNGSDLMQKYHSLSRKSEQLKELRKSEAALGELCARSSSLLWTRRWHLVQDIQIIYPIDKDDHGKLKIIDIHLPACQGDGDGLRQVPEAYLAVALGRAAHVVAIAASLLGVPLRHPLRLMGSRTKVLDHLSSPPNEIPLFARNKDSMMFRYGLFLLNKNIVQLLWATHHKIPSDPKDTLLNLLKLLTPPPYAAGLEMSRMYGSGSSMETASVGGFGMAHPFSAPSLTPDNTAMPQLVSSTSNPSVSSGAIRKIPPQSLRSLVAVGGDRSARSIMVSGGFGNMSGRQFNRFKDSVDGHSPKAAMVIRKHRYSRSVGSYVDEQVLQSLEMSPTSVIGSEPSLLMHNSNADPRVTDAEDTSDSPGGDMQNVMSFSESDLTKVSGIMSSETVSPGDEFKEAVKFSLGGDDDDENSAKTEAKKHTTMLPKQKSLEENLMLLAINNSKKQCVLSKENVEVQNLQLDVDQLSKELKQICSDYSSEDNSEVSHRQDKRKTEPKCSENGSDPKTCCDIEKLDCLKYCSKPCNIDCPHMFEKITNEDPETIQDMNAEEPMNDVIVLPSAEAVLSTISHFNDSISLEDLSESQEDAQGDSNGDALKSDDPCDDNELICMGSSASHDANRLLESLSELTLDTDCELTKSVTVEENVPSEAAEVCSNIKSDIR